MEFKSNEQLEDLYKQTAWHFEAKTKKKGSSYDWFKQVCMIKYSVLYLKDYYDTLTKNNIRFFFPMN